MPKKSNSRKSDVYTPWCEDKNPDQPGPYQILVVKSLLCEDDPLVGYQYWDGEKWGTFAETPDIALFFKGTRSFFQKPVWRGLMHKPQ